MRIYIFILFFLLRFLGFAASNDTIIIDKIPDTLLVNHITIIEKDSINIETPHEESLLIAVKRRSQRLDDISPMDFAFNETNYQYILKYLGRDKKLISRMLGLSPYYFPMIEHQLDKFQIPLELKYLAIVESALNPKSRSKSGAIGLWQFMYPTAKEYGLDITSYIDERQDPLKSTIAACEYFEALYNMFEDWNLVLAAYNGGPSYLRRVMIKTELTNYWDLRPYLKKETQSYVPSFIAVSYVMTYHKEHSIEIFDSHIDIKDRDTISFNKQVPYYLISDMFCVSNGTLNYLNPSFKRELLPKGDVICLPRDVIMDIVRNEDYFYEYLKRVEEKEILVNETREIYIVEKGDSLSKIAKQFGLKVPDIKHWNNLHSDNLSIGDKLILYIADEK